MYCAKMTKKLLLFAIALVAVVGLLAACGGGGSSKGITIGVPKHVSVTDFENNAFTKWLEETTGHEITVIEFPFTAADYKQKLATITAGNQKLPDILWYFKIGDDLVSSYGQGGYFINLKPYYDDKEKSKNFWDSFEKLDDYDKQWFYHKIEDSQSKEWYALPYVTCSDDDRPNYQPWIRTDWLDAVGKQVPTNTEELIDVLTAFRDGDPNKNGKADEIPCMGSNNKMGGNAISWLLNMKFYFNPNSWVNVDSTGKASAVAITDEYREALKWVHDLMTPQGNNNALVSPMSMVQTAATLKQTVATDTVGLFLGHPASIFSSAEEMGKWTPVPIWGYSLLNDNDSQYCNFITDSCKDPDAAWEILMAMYSEEGKLRQRYGEKGVNWDYADADGKDILGEPANVKLYSDPFTALKTQATWHNAPAGIFSTTIRFQVDETSTEAERDQEQKVYEMTKNHFDAQVRTPVTACRRLMWTTKLKQEAPYRGDVTAVFDKWTDQFCKGTDTADIYNDAHWNAYLQEFKDARGESWLEVVQKVVDNMIKNGNLKLN